MGALRERDRVDGSAVAGGRAMSWGVAFGASGLLGARAAVASSEGAGLAVVAALDEVELLAQALAFPLPVGPVGFEGVAAAVALLATRARRQHARVPDQVHFVRRQPRGEFLAPKAVTMYLFSLLSGWWSLYIIKDVMI
jgi:hypothetical protein